MVDPLSFTFALTCWPKLIRFSFTLNSQLIGRFWRYVLLPHWEFDDFGKPTFFSELRGNTWMADVAISFHWVVLWVALSVPLQHSTRGRWRHFYFILMEVFLNLWTYLWRHTVLAQHWVTVLRLSFVFWAHSSTFQTYLGGSSVIARAFKYLPPCFSFSLIKLNVFFFFLKWCSHTQSGNNLVNSQPGSKQAFQISGIAVPHRTRTLLTSVTAPDLNIKAILYTCSLYLLIPSFLDDKVCISWRSIMSF